MFSVIIPLYNKELSVKNTLDSVLAQTFKEFEIVIVNDGSTDNSFEIVKKIEDPRIRLIDKSNGGVSSARNRGIKEASFQWTCFLDADDLWEVNHLEVLRELINCYPDDKVFCTSYIRSNQEVKNTKERFVNVIEDYFLLAHLGFFCSSVGCIHKEVYDKVGFFNENLNRGEDLEFWAKIGRKYKFIQSNQITAIYRIEAENRSDKISYDINKSFLSLISFKNTSDTEKKYYRKLIFNASKRFLKNQDWKNLLIVLKKYFK